MNKISTDGESMNDVNVSEHTKQCKSARPDLVDKNFKIEDHSLWSHKKGRFIMVNQNPYKTLDQKNLVNLFLDTVGQLNTNDLNELYNEYKSWLKQNYNLNSIPRKDFKIHVNDMVNLSEV